MTRPILTALTVLNLAAGLVAGVCTDIEPIFIRSTGTPRTDTVMFDVANPSGTFFLEVENGPEGHEPISSATIWL